LASLEPTRNAVKMESVLFARTSVEKVVNPKKQP
jgi:hypothetical protein